MVQNKDKNTESQILNAAKNVFQRNGMDGSRMQEIADEAGINKAMLHYYYRSKQMLFEAVFKGAFSLLAPQFNKILNDDNSLEEKIKKFTSSYISFTIEHPYLPNFVLQELNRNPEFILKMQRINEFPNIQKFKDQVTSEVKKGRIKAIKGEQLFINILALNIFPFIASPLLKGLVKADDKAFKQLMENRKTEVADFIINSIKVPQ